MEQIAEIIPHEYSSIKSFQPICVGCGRTLGTWKIEGNHIPAPCIDCFPDEYERQVKLQELDDKRQRIARLQIGSQLTPRFASLTLDSYEIYDPAQEQVVAICREFAGNFPAHQESGTWLALIGGCGTGKGHLAAGICNEIMERHLASCLYLKYHNLVRRVKNSWDREGRETEEQILASAREADLLVLDEIGVQFNTPAERLILYAVLDDRYEWYRPTILTSNLTIEQIEKVAGERVVSRLMDKGNKVMRFTWADYRQKQ